MKTDRELLEFAAKAIHDPVEGWTADADFVPVAILRSGARWQPLLPNRITDCMGDALRLAVKAGIFCDPDGDELNECVRAGAQGIEILIPAGQDRYAAACLAIVRAAAEVGGETP